MAYHLTDKETRTMLSSMADHLRDADTLAKCIIESGTTGLALERARAVREWLPAMYQAIERALDLEAA